MRFGVRLESGGLMRGSNSMDSNFLKAFQAIICKSEKSKCEVTNVHFTLDANAFEPSTPTCCSDLADLAEGHFWSKLWSAGDCHSFRNFWIKVCRLTFQLNTRVGLQHGDSNLELSDGQRADDHDASQSNKSLTLAYKVDRLSLSMAIVFWSFLRFG